MKLISHQIERERRFLTKFAFFDPRFVQIYGSWGRLALLLVSLPMLVSGIVWLDPTKRNYSEGEVFNLWLGIAVMPIASFMVGNAIGEFVIKSFTLLSTVAKQGFKTRIQTRLLCALSSILILGGIISLLALRDGDLWAYPAFGLGMFVLYWFVNYAWSDWYQNRSVQQTGTINLDTSLHGKSS